jgi:hypothetical protein
MLVLPIFLLAFLLQLFLPWWSIGLVSFALSMLIPRSGKQAFWGGFGGIFLLWLVKGLWHTLPNDNLLANRVGRMLMLPAAEFNWIIVLLVTCLIGGLAAGFAALSGYLVRSSFIKPNSQEIDLSLPRDSN